MLNRTNENNSSQKQVAKLHNFRDKNVILKQEEGKDRSSPRKWHLAEKRLTARKKTTYCLNSIFRVLTEKNKNKNYHSRIVYLSLNGFEENIQKN